MKKLVKRSPYATAQLVVINAVLYAEEKGKEISRYRLSKASLKRMAGRARLHPSFLLEVDEALAELGWQFIEHGDAEFSVIEISKIAVWPKLSSKRLLQAGLLESPEEEIDNLFQKYFQGKDIRDDEE